MVHRDFSKHFIGGSTRGAPCGSSPTRNIGGTEERRAPRRAWNLRAVTPPEAGPRARPASRCPDTEDGDVGDNRVAEAESLDAPARKEAGSTWGRLAGPRPKRGILA